jgi:hypothetical protein
MKLTKSQKIIILKAKVIKLKAKLKEAQLELADRDDQDELVIELQKFLKIKDDYIQKHLAQPIESTDQLFTTERVNESIKDLENEIDNILTIEQLKEDDVLVDKEGVEYRIVKEEDKMYLRHKKFKPLLPLWGIDLDQFTLKDTTTGEIYPTATTTN